MGNYFFTAKRFDRDDRKRIADDMRGLAARYGASLNAAIEREHRRVPKPGTVVPRYSDTRPVTSAGLQEAADLARPLLQGMRDRIAKARVDLADAKAAPPSDECLRALQGLGLRDGDIDPAELDALDAKYGAQNYTAHQVIRQRAARQHHYIAGDWDMADALLDDISAAVDRATPPLMAWTHSASAMAGNLKSAIDAFEGGVGRGDFSYLTNMFGGERSVEAVEAAREPVVNWGGGA